MSSNQQSIVLEGLGPHSQAIVIPVQPGGSILRGRCGAGKSITLEAIAVALGSDNKSRVKPNVNKHGATVACCGVILNVSASRITRQGDAEVGSLEEFDLESLIYPPFKKESAKNEHGIKSLLRMTKTAADPAAFYHLAGDKQAFDALVGPEAQKTSDLVELAGRIKRAFQKKSNEVEAEAVKEEAEAAAHRDAMKGLDSAAESDPAKLQAAHTKAVQEFATIKAQWDAYQAAQQAAAEARKKLAEVNGSGNGLSMQAAQDSLQVAKANLEGAAAASRDAKAEIARIEAELKAAKAAYGSALVAQQAADDAVTAAENAVKAVEENAKLYAGWQAAIDNAAGTCPDPQLVRSLEEAVDDAQDAMERGAVLRNAKQRVERAAAHQKKADELRKEAHRLNLAADGTDSVLSAAVASTRFSVQADLLMGHLPGGIVKPMYALSDGERSLLAIFEKIDRVCDADPSDRLKLLDVGQRTWQDLPESLHDEILRYAYDRNVCVVSAAVSDDETMTVEVWQPKTAPINGKAGKLAAAV